MEDVPLATKVADFNETEFKRFAMREGDLWSFSLPYSELQNLDDLLPDHVLSVKTKPLEPFGEIMLGKLTPKK